MRKLHVLIGIGIIATALIASTALAATGIVQSMFPPGNTGDSHGAGQIEETDDDGNNPMGRPYFIFQTPQDVSGPMCEGALVTFIPDDQGHRAVGVEVIDSSCGPCPIPPCEPG